MLSPAACAARARCHPERALCAHPKPALLRGFPAALVPHAPCRVSSLGQPMHPSICSSVFFCWFGLVFFLFGLSAAGYLSHSVSSSSFLPPVGPRCQTPGARWLFPVPFSRVSGEARPCRPVRLHSAGMPTQNLPVLGPMKRCGRRRSGGTLLFPSFLRMSGKVSYVTQQSPVPIHRASRPQQYCNVIYHRSQGPGATQLFCVA